MSIDLQEPRLAIIGSQPEALLLSVLFAESKTPNYLVGSFELPRSNHERGQGIEEALWLLAVHRKSGRIRLLSDLQEVPFSTIGSVIISGHATNLQESNDLERVTRVLAANLSRGSTLIFTGLCKPAYTSTVLQETIEKYSGMRIGADVGLSYVPLFWTGETIQDFREKPKVVASVGERTMSLVQATLLQVFPSIISAPRIEAAEAAGLFTTIAREVAGALELELAEISKRQGLDYNEVLNLCKGSGIPLGVSRPMVERDPVGSTIAIAAVPGKKKPHLIGAARRVNDDFQTQILLMIKNGLDCCGRGIRRSKVTILGLNGFARNVWSKPEPAQILQTLRTKGAKVSIYPSDSQMLALARKIGSGMRIETNLLKAVSGAHCAVVALDSTAGRVLDPATMALEMSRPAAICDLTGVLEVSSVERAGLFYTSIGRGPLDT